jgi:uncharacterized membrane protein YdbT with pleckstrin-like domain
MLHDGEQIVVEVRPHWWFLTGPVAVVALVVAGEVVALVESAPNWADYLVLAVLAVAVAWLVARYLRWFTTRLILTTSRIIERRGVFSRSGREIPLSALSDIGYHQSFFERLIGAGDVLLESAGHDGQETFPDLPHPASIQNEIYAQLERYRSAGRVVAGPPSASIPEQIGQLDQLRQRGVLSDAEFEAKKAELLRRL